MTDVLWGRQRVDKLTRSWHVVVRGESADSLWCKPRLVFVPGATDYSDAPDGGPVCRQCSGYWLKEKREVAYRRALCPTDTSDACGNLPEGVRCEAIIAARDTQTALGHSAEAKAVQAARLPIHAIRERKLQAGGLDLSKHVN
jgi:hypothetical protein